MTQIIYPRPIGGGPRPGGSSGAAGAITYPAERPRLVELQIDAGAFGLLIMNRIRAETICAGQEFQLSKDEPVYVVDHVEFDQPATLGDPPHHHGSGLQLGLLDGGIGLLDQGGVVLGHLVELAHRRIDLLDRGRLLAAGGGDGFDQAAALARRRQHGAELAGRLPHQFGAAGDLVGRHTQGCFGGNRRHSPTLESMHWSRFVGAAKRARRSDRH